jgi:hypothetical protein
MSGEAGGKRLSPGESGVAAPLGLFAGLARSRYSGHRP